MTDPALCVACDAPATMIILISKKRFFRTCRECVERLAKREWLYEPTTNRERTSSSLGRVTAT